jgi:hypothetical protein
VNPSVFALRLVEQEVAGLIHRMQLVKPFSLHETMVPAAQPGGDTLRRIDRYLGEGRRALIASAQKFRHWLLTIDAERTRSESIYRQYVFLRLQMTAALAQFDLFSDAITQRSEADTGVLLSGLDVLARDSLSIANAPYEIPPLICYLDRGVGAAIRRARTRLPGGGENPAAIIRVPRERMVGLGIASSLVHEAGHQGAALLDLVPTLRQAMEPLVAKSRNADGSLDPTNPWASWHRWISEIVADLWSVSRVGMASTMGLINVVSLPRVFVFRSNTDDPHPTPWIRVMLSAEIGRQLYPNAQWQRLSALWQLMYPRNRRDVENAAAVAMLNQHIPVFVDWLLRQRIPASGGLELRSVLVDPAIAPKQLSEHLERWHRDARYPDRLRPCQVFALVGYARLVRGQTPNPETPLITRLLTRWALAQ